MRKEARRADGEQAREYARRVRYPIFFFAREATFFAAASSAPRTMLVFAAAR